MDNGDVCIGLVEDSSAIAVAASAALVGRAPGRAPPSLEPSAAMTSTPDDLDRQIVSLCHACADHYRAPESPTLASRSRTPSTIELRQRTISAIASPSTASHANGLSESNQADIALRVSTVHTLTKLMLSARLLTTHQSAFIHFGVDRRSHRFLQIIDGFLQKEKAYHLSLRAHLLTPSGVDSESSHHAIVNHQPIKLFTHSDLIKKAAKIEGTTQSLRPLSSLLSTSTPFLPFVPSEALKESMTECLIDTLNDVWNTWFDTVSTAEAKRLSRAERAAKSLNDPSLVYGEITFQVMAAILWSLPSLPSGGVFVDLGSGTGRALVAAVLLHDFLIARGIETLSSLFKVSVATKDRIDAHRRSSVYSSHSHTNTSANTNSDADSEVDLRPPISTKLHLDNSSFLVSDWSEADVVFANSTCFDPELMIEIAKRAELLKPGSYVITLTKRLESPHLTLIDATQYEGFSWGSATVYVWRRNDN